MPSRIGDCGRPGSVSAGSCHEPVREPAMLDAAAALAALDAAAGGGSGRRRRQAPGAGVAHRDQHLGCSGSADGVSGWGCPHCSTMTSLLVPLQRCGIGDAPAVGRTAAVLGELRADGCAMPDGVVLIPAAGMLSDAGLAGLLREVVGLIGGGRYVVRSSEIGEELDGEPEAGREATVFDVEADGLVAAVRSCWASAAERVRRRDGGAHVAVLVQRMVAATAVGAAVSADPVTG